MIINHNIAALNTYRQLSGNNTISQKSLEKLSSGLRINRAGDDAAGLAISEKMRAQIRGLDQASRNAQDGISLIQTAEGALNETHSILQRMRELANQAANDTNVDVDREEIQKEINQLTSEINRVGNTTEFNKQLLLNGGGADPKTTQRGSIIDVPKTMSGGIGAANTLTTDLKVTYTITETFADDVEQAAADGREIVFTIGEKEVKLTLNNGLSAANSTATQVGISDVTTAVNLADAIEKALTKAFEEDAYLSENYAITGGSDADIVIGAKAYSFSGGRATGLETGLRGKIEIATDIEHTSAVTTSAVGSYARADIDFSGKTGADLVGTSLWVSGKEIAFYDSSEGDYTGGAAFKVDLNGATTGEAIVDRIVNEMFNKTGAADTKGGYSAAANESYMENVDFFKDPGNSNILVLHAGVDEADGLAIAAGADGNKIAIEFDAPLAVTSTVDSPMLSGEKIVSAKGLEDGMHTIKLTYSAASAVAGADTTTSAGLGITVGTTTNFESGTYRLTNNNLGVDHAQLQKLGADGSTWTTVAGYEDISLTDSVDNTIGDITITGYTAGDITDAAAGTKSFNFTIQKQGYTVALQEANDESTTWGPYVAIESGQKNITLTTNDGIGSVTFDVGDISEDLVVGAYTEINFVTTKSTGTDVSGGTFTAKLQIGANQGQSMQIDINDMRSLALQVSGTAAASKAGGVDGAFYTEISTVTNGTDNENVEYALDVSTHEKASAAITVINNAIEKVSAQRSALGAYQNRLEHTINNLGTSSENLTAAESRIRDVDMAKEMMEFTKMNILSQAAQAMLAQANQQPQGVLQLLR
jgi:flagellin